MTKVRFFRFLMILAVMSLVALMGVACASVRGQTNSPTEIAQPSPTVQPTSTAQPTPTRYVGKFQLSPDQGPARTMVTATGQGFDSDTQLSLVWQGFIGSWNVKDGGFLGRQFQDKLETLGTVNTDAMGVFETNFVVPDGFGFIHDVLVMKDGQILNKAAFDVKMQVSISPSGGPAGTPINITAKGIGWRPLENSWMVLYDNKFTGWLSSVTTDGSASAVIPAAGAPGKHIIQILHGSATFPYMNMQQSPQPDRPTWTLEFTMTDGAAIQPLPAQQQGLAIEQGAPPATTVGPYLWANPVSGPIGTTITLKGEALPGQQVEIIWFTMKGSRVSGQGFGETSTSLGTVTAGSDGAIDFSFQAPDDLGGPHLIQAQANGQKLAEANFTITPSAFAIEPSSGQAGTTITIHLKGVGWTETANIYTLVYDNGYLGYACGFNSQGDVTIYLPAAGAPGWHFIDLYPGIYKGQDMDQTNDFRIPQLTFNDHPGERLPAFHFAFLIIEAGS